MAIKYTLQGLLVYLTIASYVVAFIATTVRRKKMGQGLFLAGFCVALLSYVYRWVDAKAIWTVPSGFPMCTTVSWRRHGRSKRAIIKSNQKVFCTAHRCSNGR